VGERAGCGESGPLCQRGGLRWLEWGTTAYWSFVMGLALVLLGIVVAWTGRVPRPIGIFMGAAGLATIVTGWFTATSGFGGAAVPPTLISFGSVFAFAMWLLIGSWRMDVADRPELRSQARPDKGVRVTPAGGT